jgi:hypothetical protein
MTIKTAPRRPNPPFWRQNAALMQRPEGASGHDLWNNVDRVWSKAFHRDCRVAAAKLGMDWHSQGSGLNARYWIFPFGTRSEGVPENYREVRGSPRGRAKRRNDQGPRLQLAA